MIQININATNFDGVRKALNNLGDKIQNPDEKLMRLIGDTVVDDIDQRFNTRGYGTWPPLQPSTAKRKGNDFVLIDTGVMVNSTKIGFPAKGKVNVSVPVGGKHHDARVPGFHQNGTNRMPQRKIIEVTPKLKTAIVDTVVLWIRDMIKAFRLST